MTVAPDAETSAVAERVAQGVSYGAATLHEAANQVGALPAQLKPAAPGFRLCGPAFPTRCTGGNNIWLHRAVYAAPQGSIIVASVGDGYEFGYWGEVLSVAALERGLGGLVIDGCVRDVDAVSALGFPIFSRGLCIRGTGKDPAGGGLTESVRLGEVEVRRGDLVVGDADGVVVLPAADVDRVLAAAEAREAKEADYLRRLRQGARTVDLYGLV